MRSEEVLQELNSNGVDALLDYREVIRNPPIPTSSLAENAALQCFSSAGNLALAWRRFVGLNLFIPIPRSGPRIGRHTFYLPVTALHSPFGPQFKCYYGDHWFSGNQKVADILLNPDEMHMRLRRHLRWRIVPEESYYHTVLGNAAHLKLSTATRRFANWNGSRNGHPRNLELRDLPTIVEAKAYFARKFAPDFPALDEIDRLLGC